MPREILRAIIEPRLLVWARETLGLSIEDAARKINRKPERIASWESGQEKPPIKTLEALAEVYKRPVALFFLQDPPPQPSLPANFRRLPDGEVVPFSPKTLLAIRKARYSQYILRELYRDLGILGKVTIPIANAKEDPERLAKQLRELLGYNSKKIVAAGNEYAAYDLRRSLVENSGIFTFQMSLPIEETRGFSLWDEHFPIIVANSSDAINARSFSLFHEIAHLLLRHNGICNWTKHLSEEVFCNMVSGALLVPMDELFAEIKKLGTDPQDEESVIRLSTEFRVSKEVTLRRMLVGEIVTREHYRRMRERWLAQESKGEKRKAKGGPPPAVKCVAEKGVSYVGTVLKALESGAVDRGEASDMLGVKTGEIGNVEEILYSKRSRT